LAYLDATYDDYRNAACTAAQSLAWTGPPGSRCVQDLSGRTPAHAPEWTGFASINHDLAFENGMHLRSFLVGTYADDQYISSDLNEVLQQGGYFMFDLGATLFGTNDKWDVGILGKNVTDERAMSYGAAVSFFTGAYAATIIEPLTVTLSAHYRF
jgi:iron complex outermembrane recepter protein